jgi:hypothetical protein
MFLAPFLAQSPNLSILFGTLSVFAVGQSIFWIHVGARQYENVVKDKIQIAQLFFGSRRFDTDKRLQESFCRATRESTQQSTGPPKEQRQRENMDMLIRHVAPFAITTGLLALLFGLLFMAPSIMPGHFGMANASPNIRSQRKADLKAYRVALLLMLASFGTEILLFIYVIRPFNVIGDLELVDAILNPSPRIQPPKP